MITEAQVYDMLCRDYICHPPSASLSPFAIYLKMCRECGYELADDEGESDVLDDIQMHCDNLVAKGIATKCQGSSNQHYRILTPYEIISTRK